MVTLNAEDYLFLAQEAGAHCGLIVLRTPGLTATEQLTEVLRALEWLERSGALDPVNCVLEVPPAPDECRLIRIPVE
jgi:hypothetical protein